MRTWALEGPGLMDPKNLQVFHRWTRRYLQVRPDLWHALLVCPDYTSPDFAAARFDFTTATVSDAQSAELLARVWKRTNDAQKVAWQHDIDEAARRAAEDLRLRAEDEDRRKPEAEAERLEAESEAVKKNHTKFILIPSRPPPLVSLTVLSTYALRKLQKGDYIELYYFTNLELAESKSTATHADDKAMLPISDLTTGGMNWIPAGTKRSTASLVPDKELSWDQFSIVVPHILQAMANAKWTDQCTTMLATLWSGLMNHPYHFSADPETVDIDLQSLLVYQTEQRIAWHQAIDTPDGAWDIRIIDPTLL